MAARDAAVTVARGLLRSPRKVEPQVALMRVTLVKSHCSAQKAARSTLLSLGLRHPHDSVVHKNNAANRGKLFNVRNYIHVQDVPLPEGYVPPQGPALVSRSLGKDVLSDPTAVHQLLKTDDSQLAPAHARVNANAALRNKQHAEALAERENRS